MSEQTFPNLALRSPAFASLVIAYLGSLDRSDAAERAPALGQQIFVIWSFCILWRDQQRVALYFNQMITSYHKSHAQICRILSKFLASIHSILQPFGSSAVSVHTLHWECPRMLDFNRMIITLHSFEMKMQTRLHFGRTGASQDEMYAWWKDWWSWVYVEHSWKRRWAWPSISGVHHEEGLLFETRWLRRNGGCPGGFAKFCSETSLWYLHYDLWILLFGPNFDPRIHIFTMRVMCKSTASLPFMTLRRLLPAGHIAGTVVHSWYITILLPLDLWQSHVLTSLWMPTNVLITGLKSNRLLL